MTDKRQKAAKVKCKRDELWNIVFSKSSIWVLLKLIRRWTQHFTKIDLEKRKIEQICIWNPMTTGFIYVNIDLRHQYGIWLLLSLSRRRSSSRNIPQRRWARRNVCRSQATGNPERTRSAHLARSGNQSEHRIPFTFPCTCEVSHVIIL